MPRNSAGVYTLPEPPFVVDTVIDNVAVNSDFSDIGTALTGSLARNGDGGMTGQLKAADGTVGAPGITWGNDLDSGFYRIGSTSFAAVINGVAIATISSTGVDVTALSIAGNGVVTGPASSTDNALARFNGTPGDVIQDSSFATLSDAGALVVSGTAASADLQRSAAAPYLYLTRTDTHGDLASISLIGFYGKDDGGTTKRYNFINVTAVQDAAGSETGRVEIGGRSAGTDATRFIVQAGLQIGSPTGGDQGVGTTNAVAYYINGRLVYPAGCWGYVTYSAGTPTLQDSHNVTSITDTGTGDLGVTIATDHANALYSMQATGDNTNLASGPGDVLEKTSARAVGGFNIICHNYNSATLADPGAISFATFGDI